MNQTAAPAADAGLKLAAPRALYFAIFAISGFSGLIYESIWSHYLKLFLGHAAYAQSLVLVIFMGGMAIGSWVASRYSNKVRSPILIYAAVEAIVGVVALLFHSLFVGLVDVSHDTILPAIGSPLAGILFKWFAAGAIILPQSILLGMTFPLMSAGIIRRFPDTPGGSIAMLYFTNSIGAAIGVLASGFWLIGKLGLPGTIFTAGLLNLALALVVWILVRMDPKPDTQPLTETAGDGARHELRYLFLLAAFITGAASFIYEISWIRMLSLVLGATTHSFELMLSAFIAGLALGGLWIKRRIDRIDNPVEFSGFVQLIMGVLALLTIPVYVNSFDWMAWLLDALQRNNEGFAFFTLSSHVIALAVMLPTTFMAGMTLPLFTYVLVQKGEGEASIGRIYASNTIGAIVGVLFAVHIGLPIIGLKGLIVLGAGLDIALAVLLLMRAAPERGFAGKTLVGSTAGVAAIVFALLFTSIDQRLLTSGVYRYGDNMFASKDEILFYKDGKTASVSLRQTPSGSIVLATNGKPDASIIRELDREPTVDEITMTLAAAIPLAYKPDAVRVANIGMGSGQTTHVLLADSDIEVVDTVEIEQQMVEASKGFGDAVGRAYNDPRSRIHIEDAKTFFAMHNSRYDIIIAEPSNPWVSGVSSLFSVEFYDAVTDFLEDDGLFVQWIQLYEFTDVLAESIMKALATHFSDYTVFTTDGVNVLFVAKKTGTLNEPDWDSVLNGELKASLDRVGVRTVADLDVRKIVESNSISPYVALSDTPINSDYFPYVDLNAGKARFLGSQATMFKDWMLAPLPLAEMLNGDSIAYNVLNEKDPFPRAAAAKAASDLYAGVMFDGMNGLAPSPLGRFEETIAWLRLARSSCSSGLDVNRWRNSIHQVSMVALPFLDAERGERLVETLLPVDCDLADDFDDNAWRRLYGSIATRDAATMSALATDILANDASVSGNEGAYLLAVAMLGDIAQGRSDRAFQSWERYGGLMFEGGDLPGHIRLLLGIAVVESQSGDVMAAR